MFSVCYRYADVAELADALDLGSSGRPCRFNSCHPQAIKRLRRDAPQSFYVARHMRKRFDGPFLSPQDIVVTP